MATDKIEILIEAKVKKAINDLNKVTEQSKKTGKGVMSLGGIFKIVAGSFVVKKIIDGLIHVTKKAMDAQETISKFNTVFESVRKEADLVAKNLVDNFGLSSIAAKQLLGDTGDLLVGFGFTEKASLDLAKEVNELAVDLASFTNFSGGAEGASKALTKALLGERESVKSLGIAILEKDVKAKIKSMEATGKLTNQTDRQKRAMATMAIAVEQSGKAMGDFARTSDQTANQVRIFRSRLSDIFVVIGSKLLPAFTKLIVKINDLMIATSSHEKALNKYKKATEDLNVANKEVLKLIKEGKSATDEYSIAYSNLEVAQIKERVALYEVRNEQRKLNDEIKNAPKNIKELEKGIVKLTKRRDKAIKQAERERKLLSEGNKLFRSETGIKTRLNTVMVEINAINGAIIDKTEKINKIKNKENDLTKLNTELKIVQMEKEKERNEIDKERNDVIIPKTMSLEQLKTDIEKQNIKDLNSLRKRALIEEIANQEEITDLTKDELIQRFKDADENKKKLKKIDDEKKKWAETISGAITNIWAEDLKDQKLSAKKVGAAIIMSFADAIAGELEVIAAANTAKAIASLLSVAGAAAAPGYFAAAGAATAGAIGINVLGRELSNKVMSAATGADFVTSGPQMMMVGDNPSGREHVSVTPSETTNNNNQNTTINVATNDPIEFVNTLKRQYGVEVFQ